MIFLFLLMIFFLGNSSFALLPWHHNPGVFRLSDLGLLLIFIALLYQFVTNPKRDRCFNAAGFLIIGYLFMALLHVANASINYNQSILVGMLQVRHQFYYLSYFVFLLGFCRPGVAELFMKYIVWMAFTILVLAMINYVGPELFYHQWADGHGIRSGIVRAFIPGMEIMVMAFLWCLLRFTEKGKLMSRECLGMLTLLFGLLFRQTRGRIIAAFLASAWLLYRERNFKMLIYSAIAVTMLSLMMAIVMQQNLLQSGLESAYTDIKNKEGTWADRLKTIDSAVETFNKHFFIGSGALLIHGYRSELPKEFRMDSYQGDLGYIHWFKNFGVVGIIWLVLMVIVCARQTRLNRKSNPDDYVSKFGEYQLVQIAFGFITINYLGKPPGILVFCLALALLFSSERKARSGKR
jgi:O-Antigen ligase